MVGVQAVGIAWLGRNVESRPVPGCVDDHDARSEGRSDSDKGRAERDRLAVAKRARRKDSPFRKHHGNIGAMPWIRTVSVEAASGRLAASYRAAVDRAGRVFGILRTMSLQPAVLGASVALYVAIMKEPGDLSLVQREMLATVVSRANDCHY